MQIVYQTNAIIWKCTCRPSSQMLFNMIECAFARRPSIQMCFLCAQMCSRSMPNDSNAYLSCANNAFARCLSLHMHFLYVEIWFRSTPADPNAFPLCSNVLSPDACRSKCMSCVLRCAIARRPSIQMCFLCAHMRSRPFQISMNLYTSDTIFARIWIRSCSSSDTATVSLLALVHFVSFGYVFCPDLELAIFELRCSSPKLRQI